MTRRRAVGWVLGFSLVWLPLHLQAQAMKEDKGHVYTWNKFAEDAYQLHLRQLQGRRIREESSMGGYPGQPDYYREVKYFDTDSGLLLSVVQREAAQPENIHSVTVNVYDEQGRVVRDYSSTYLPEYRNAPTQTLIFLHRYNDGLHAFRSFDASDDLLYQRCEGSLAGEPVFIAMDIEDIEEAAGELYQTKSGIMTEPAYKACFDTMPETAAGALPPR